MTIPPDPKPRNLGVPTSASAFPLSIVPNAEVVAALAAVVDGIQVVAETVRRALVEHNDEIVAFAHGIAEAHRWFETAPEKLTQALAESGWLLHHDLSVSDYRRVTETFDASGAEAAATLAGRMNIELFDNEAFRAELGARWSRSARAVPLDEIRQAFELGLYSVCIPAALALCEGLIASLSNHVGMMRQEAMKRHAQAAFSDDPFMAGPVEKFLEVLTVHFKHGGPIPKPLSRHAILHGADFTYGTKENAVRTLVWLDVLVAVELERALVVDTSSDARGQ